MCCAVVLRRFSESLEGASRCILQLPPVKERSFPEEAKACVPASREEDWRERAICVVVQSLHELGRSKEAFASVLQCYKKKPDAGLDKAELPSCVPPTGKCIPKLHGGGLHMQKLHWVPLQHVYYM